MSASLVGVVRGLFAIANVHSSGAFLMNRGFSLVTKTGTGVYVLTLQDSISLIDAATALAGMSKTGAASVSIDDDDGSDGATITVYTFNAAGAAADNDFSIQVQDVAPN